jgi:hypothetical protein
MGADMAKAVKLPTVGLSLPTATQDQSVTQDTAATLVCTTPFGVLGTIDQAVPFHDSAKLAGEGFDAASAKPTALHVVALKQSTPVRAWLSVPEVSGTEAVIAHCVPFQLSTRFWVRGPAWLTWPAA